MRQVCILAGSEEMRNIWTDKPLQLPISEYTWVAMLSLTLLLTDAFGPLNEMRASVLPCQL